MNLALTRRELLLAAGALGLSLTRDGRLVADEQTCVLTPPQTPGPFYPQPSIARQKFTDNDLTRKFAEAERAMGEEIVVEGLVRDRDCRPLQNAVVEIWQASASGRYNHPDDRNDAPLDEHFQYWGRGVTGEDGKYAFRTIKPGEYPGRTAHIHFRILAPGHRDLVTQMYFAADAKRNAQDGIYRRLDRPERNAVTIEFDKPTGKKHPRGNFDIVLAAK